MQRQLIGSIKINNYIRKVQLSKAQREKYYEWDGVTIKCRSKKLLQKYINPVYKESIIRNDGNVLIEYLIPTFVIIGFKGTKVYSQQITKQNEYVFASNLTQKQLSIPTKYILCKEIPLGQYVKVLANETQAGKPKYHIINGQAFYNQTLNPFARVKVMETIKEMYYDKLVTIPNERRNTFINKLNSSYPLIIEMEIRDTIKSVTDRTKKGNGQRWDVGNRAEPYMKGFLDFLVKGYITKEEIILMPPLIKDDDRLHVTSGNNAFFTPIEEDETPSLVFHFYKDMTPVWITILKP